MRGSSGIPGPVLLSPALEDCVIPIHNKLAQMANGKVLVVLLIVGLIFLFIFRYRDNALKTYSGKKDEEHTLDSNICYDSKYAYALFDKLEDRGRKLYAWTEITVDLIFPIIYAAFLSLFIIHLFQKCSINTSQQFVVMLPFIAMLFDYGENILIAIMLFAYPHEYPALASIASVFTKLKWSFVAVSSGAILYGLACLAIKFVTKQ